MIIQKDGVILKTYLKLFAKFGFEPALKTDITDTPTTTYSELFTWAENCLRIEIIIENRAIKIYSTDGKLLKLNTAVQQQGEENKRQSESNRKNYNNQSNALPAALLDYLNSIEILNRQSLPLRSNFNQKVQEYFNKK